jgi:GDPmannose 4,6-dehydratase
LTRVLITGVTGQDGSLLATALRGEGHEIHGLCQTGLAIPAPIRELLDGVTLHDGDLADAAGIGELVDAVAPDEVYHLAGQSSVALSWEDPIGTLVSTGLGAGIVFEAAYRLQERRGTPVRVLQASSAEIFGRAEQTPQDEDTPVRPVSPYGVAKATAHQLASVYRQRGLFVACTILYNHESTLRPPSFVTRKITMGAARISVEGGELTLGNLDAGRDWGWAPDYVRAMVLALRHTEPDDFVVATGEVHTVEDFVRVAFARAGIANWQAHVRTDPAFVRPVDAAVQVGDASKARRVLGWAPSVGFDDLVGRMVEHDLALAHLAGDAG